MTLPPIRAAGRHCFGGPEIHMIALCMQSGDDFHAIENGGLRSAKAPAQPSREGPTTLY
jgi:hypothetical protein